MTMPSDLIFLGDSLTAFHDWSAFGKHRNAGIAGDTTDGLLRRLRYTLEQKPKALVLMIGINDLLQGLNIDTMKKNYREIFAEIETIDTVVALSLLPVKMVSGTCEINEKVIRLNHYIKQESEKRGFVFCDLYRSMADKNGGLKESYTSDGIHLTPKAYRIWEEYLQRKLQQT